MWFERYVISRHKYSINLTQKNVTCVPGDQNLKLFAPARAHVQEYCMVSIGTFKTSEKSICAFHVMNCSRRRFKSDSQSETLRDLGRTRSRDLNIRREQFGT